MIIRAIILFASSIYKTIALVIYSTYRRNESAHIPGVWSGTLKRQLT
jgi:hypothetical protein